MLRVSVAAVVTSLLLEVADILRLVSLADWLLLALRLRVDPEAEARRPAANTIVP